MLEAPVKYPLWFCYGCLCLCCSQYQLRVMVLGEDWPKGYTCCQSYLSCACIQGGKMGEQSAPECCLCLEVVCCPGCAVSASRMLIMDKYNIVPDPMDNKIIRFSNCLQCLSCIIQITNLFVDLGPADEIIYVISQVVFYVTAGCMTSQAVYELKVGGPPGSGVGEGAPKGAPQAKIEMER